ncbi:hypothetical protein [Cupriavidus sp. TMH.W2]|uniref:hypothetical protein n=1 Tax=Cupriavidus sp. TMH.W2 TaxID=3434465 RepID=UPI003D7754B6
MIPAGNINGEKLGFLRASFYSDRRGENVKNVATVAKMLIWLWPEARYLATPIARKAAASRGCPSIGGRRRSHVRNCSEISEIIPRVVCLTPRPRKPGEYG